MAGEYVDAFKALKWDEKISIIPEDGHSYELHLHTVIGKEVSYSKKTTLSMLERVVSLKLRHPDDIYNPFTLVLPSETNILKDFTEEDLKFYEAIIPFTDDNYLKARLAEILFSRTKYQIKDWANLAIDCYTRKKIKLDSSFLYKVNEWERALVLCKKIKDLNRFSELKDRILEAIHLDHGKYNFIVQKLCSLLFKTRSKADNFDNILLRLTELARESNEQGEYHVTREYMKLAIEISTRFKDKVPWVNSSAFYANSYELEGDKRLTDSAVVAKLFYCDALKVYRDIEIKYRTVQNKIEEIISRLKHKIEHSGKQMIDEMVTIELPMPDVSDMVVNAKKHVSGKTDAKTALLYFCGLIVSSDLKTMSAEAEKSLRNVNYKSMVSTINISRDGRVIGKSPAHNKDDAKDVERTIHEQCIENYLFYMNFNVKTKLLPALDQLREEHSFSREFFELICLHSPLVPDGREKTLGLALWFGFEHDFSAAIHLLCPQIENIVRMKLKGAGEHSTTINDSKGSIEDEISLSSLVLKANFETMFGEKVAFELKTIFTESLGCNFRNQVAHGLLDDNDGQSHHSVYAWWYVLRMICHSLVRD
jgi:tetratricopeptide (TPR) repeat protein